MATNIRTHFILPKELVEEFDSRVGKGKRSAMVAQMIDDWVKHERRKEVLERFAGSISAEDHPEWATRESTYEWVRNLRGSYRDHYVPDETDAALSS